MKKQDIQQRVLQNGKPLDLDKFNWCEATKTFTTTEDDLVLDFTDIDYCTFTTGWCCTFNTGSYCTFDTGDDCTFKTGNRCTFTTGDYCVCIRKDVFEFFEIPAKTKIKLNDYKVKGYEILEKKLKFKIERIVECESEQEAQKLLKDGENIVLID